ncbi:MAG: Zn-dependent hydrolase [Bacteroidia bacterium]|nr:Zn-dependent hydrolase [Bacteroidia bacterium]
MKEESTTSIAEERLKIYAPVKLTTDMDQLSESDKKVIPILIEVAKIMDDLFYQEAYPQELRVDNATLSEAEKAFIKINYGPWDRLNNNEAFIAGIGEKPKGAGFYPLDMSEEEFKAMEAEDKSSLYTLIRRDEAGELITVPYHVAFKEEVSRASELLRKAAELADNESFKKYLNLRADALLNDDYTASDIAWMDLEGNSIDFIVGPIENYEDQLNGAKAAHEAYILVKDKEWSKRLEKYAAFMQELQEGLPGEDKYKAEKPGSNAQLNAYDVVYYAGDCNSGSKTIAVNLPNDEEIQISKGTRRSQLKNAMRAKFDQILVPISDMLIAEDQRKHITFDAFFGNTMFHEVAHGLGIKNTINGKGTVRKALGATASALEEGKADILGLYMVTQLFEKGEIDEGVLEDNYVTFLAGIFRSVRFGASSAHGKANMVRFNFFKEMGAFNRDEASGTYSVDMEKMREAMNALSTLILKLQGDGDKEGVSNLLDEKGVIGSQLQADLDRLGDAGIPVDIVFEQGVDVLGLK